MTDADWRATQRRWGARWDDDHDAPADYGDMPREYAAFDAGAALVDQTNRAQVELHGPDAAAFVHNLCTQDVRNLPVGAGAETLFLDARGHVLFGATVYRTGDALLLDADSGCAPALLAHLDRYLIRERVTLHDRTDGCAALLLAGPLADRVLRAADCGEVPSALGGQTNLNALAGGRLRRVPLGGRTAYQLVVPRGELSAFAGRLHAQGAQPAGAAAWQAARIEAGWLEFGRDVTDKNLPQELARDTRVLHFQKGCYLGQETVARLDALGHVNRLLVGLEWNGGALGPGSSLCQNGALVGTLTSAALSPRTGGFVGLGYVRRGLEQPGTQLESPAGAVVVRALPLV